MYAFDNLFLKTSSNLSLWDDPIDLNIFLPSLFDSGGMTFLFPYYNFIDYPKICPVDCEDSLASWIVWYSYLFRESENLSAYLPQLLYNLVLKG